MAISLIGRFQSEHGDVIFDEGRLWRYVGTCWQPISDHDLRLAVHEYDGAAINTGGRRAQMLRLNRTRINSILHELEVRLTRPGFFRGAAAGINCASGFIRFDSLGNAELVPHDAEHRSRFALRGRWPCSMSDEQAFDSLLFRLLQGVFLDDLDVEAKTDLILEVAAAAALGMATRIAEPRALVLHGQTAENGKSQVLDLMRGMLPDEAVVAIPLHRFGDEKHLVQLAGKLLNACDELASAQSIVSDNFKLVVTGDPVSARDVYKSVLHFRCMAQHVFASNHLPSFQGGMDRGVRRRIRVITFNRTFLPRIAFHTSDCVCAAKSQTYCWIRWCTVRRG